MTKCIGCGVTLQYNNKLELGYTSNINNNLCERCFKLKHYGKYQSVSLNNKEYKRIWDSIPKTSFTIYITDILSLDFSGIERFPNSIIVVTKKDLLPKSVKAEKIKKYIKELYPKAKDIVIVSNKNGEGIESLYQIIKKEKEVYLIGTTNSGKSSLINKLLTLEEEKSQITTSMYPSTTLDRIEIKLKDTCLIDTPGIINVQNITNYIKEEDLKKITPKKTIKPKSCQIDGSGSIIIDKYARIDYNTSQKNSLIFYVSNALTVRFTSKNNEIHHDYPKQDYQINPNEDIVIPGLGFIKCINKMNITLYIIGNTTPYIRKKLI